MDLILQGLAAIVQPEMLLITLLGVAGGLFVGALPGLTATMALALLLPFTFTLEPLQGLVALGAVYMGSIYGGSFAAILVNTPGTPSSIATAFDGYPMAKQGKAYEAICAATIASVIGGLVGVIALLVLAPPLARIALFFGPAEMFWVAMLGLTLIASLSEGSLLKGLLGGCIGMILGTIGVSAVGGESRFTFGVPALQGGVELIVALVGLFVVPEILIMAARGSSVLPELSFKNGRGDAFTRFIATARDIFSRPMNLVRSSVVGQVIAVVPGVAGSITALIAYDVARRSSKRPDSFGKGNVDGVVASECSNNVVVAGSLVPLLTLGIPGAPPDAIILGVLMLHGLRPGFELFSTHGVLTNGFILSMGVAALMMLPVGLLGGRLIYRVIVKTPYYMLIPGIALVTILGTYALRNSMFDVLIMLVLGFAGYLLRGIGVSSAPIVLGLILGSIAELGYVQSILGGMAYSVPQLRLIQNPLSQVLIAILLLSLILPIFINLRRRYRLRRAAGSGEGSVS